MNLPSRWTSRRSVAASLTSILTVTALASLSGSSVRATPPPGLFAAGVIGAEGQTGTIKGRLVWGGAEAPAPKIREEKGKASKDPAVCAKDAPILDESLLVDPASKGVRFGLAYLVKPNGMPPDTVKELIAKSPKVVIDQKQCVFIPHSVGVVEGQELVLKSSDPVSHNVNLSAFQNAPFNVIVPANGELTKNLIAEKRVLPLKCDIHPWMKANIMVYNHPYFAVTGPDGSFEIKGVPPGEQSLVVWQESVGFVTPGFANGIKFEIGPGEVKDVGEIKLDPSRVK